jgi:NAD(P)-dependent dehydrogenase (short-subunit alcohol dehydrogenase family)
MKKQTIVITGGSPVLGKTIAQLFLERGDNVVINSSGYENLQKDRQKLGSPERLVSFEGNIDDRNTELNLINFAIKQFGSVDVFINIASIFAPKPFLEVEELSWSWYLKS